MFSDKGTPKWVLGHHELPGQNQSRTHKRAAEIEAGVWFIKNIKLKRHQRIQAASDWFLKDIKMLSEFPNREWRWKTRLFSRIK